MKLEPIIKLYRKIMKEEIVLPEDPPIVDDTLVLKYRRKPFSVVLDEEENIAVVVTE